MSGAPNAKAKVAVLFLNAIRRCSVSHDRPVHKLLSYNTLRLLPVRLASRAQTLLYRHQTIGEAPQAQRCADSDPGPSLGSGLAVLKQIKITRHENTETENTRSHEKRTF